MKKEPKESVPGKSRHEMFKRITVGFLCVAWNVFPMYMHPIAHALVCSKMVFIGNREIFGIHYEGRENWIRKAQRYFLQFFIFYFCMTKSGMLERSIIERSGFSAEENPILFMILYEHNAVISSVILSAIFLYCLFKWRRRSMHRQLMKGIGRFLLLVYCSYFGSYQGFSMIHGGRWWTYIGIICVAMNDASAYFVGKLFGKHQLLRISPNKTIEGFIGGTIVSLFTTYIMASICLPNNFWQCAPRHYNYALFEDYQCDKIDPIYIDKVYDFPY